MGKDIWRDLLGKSVSVTLDTELNLIVYVAGHGSQCICRAERPSCDP